MQETQEIKEQKQELPSFTQGEEVEIKGYPFTLTRINATTLVFTPQRILDDLGSQLSKRQTIRRLRD